MRFIRQNMFPLQEILVVTLSELKHMEALGFKSFNLGPESEFFLFKLMKMVIQHQQNDKGGYFDLAPTDLADNTCREIVNVLTKMGFEVKRVTMRWAVGQHEIDF